MVPTTLSKIKATIRIRTNHSALTRWYMLNFDGFARILEGVSSPGWDAIAAVLSEDGITKGDGSPVTAPYARQTWWAVRKANAKRLAKGVPIACNETPRQGMPPLRPAAHLIAALPDDLEADEPLTFARLKT